jgi:hypothetical protein
MKENTAQLKEGDHGQRLIGSRGIGRRDTETVYGCQDIGRRKTDHDMTTCPKSGENEGATGKYTEITKTSGDQIYAVGEITSLMIHG